MEWVVSRRERTVGPVVMAWISTHPAPWSPNRFQNQRERTPLRRALDLVHRARWGPFGRGGGFHRPTKPELGSIVQPLLRQFVDQMLGGPEVDGRTLLHNLSVRDARDLFRWVPSETRKRSVSSSRVREILAENMHPLQVHHLQTLLIFGEPETPEEPAAATPGLVLPDLGGMLHHRSFSSACWLTWLVLKGLRVQDNHIILDPPKGLHCDIV